MTLGSLSAYGQVARACSTPSVCGVLDAQAALYPARQLNVGVTQLARAAPTSGQNRWKFGALIGGVIGGAVFGHLCQRDGCTTGVPIVIGVAGGAAIGAVIGKLLGPAPTLAPASEP